MNPIGRMTEAKISEKMVELFSEYTIKDIEENSDLLLQKFDVDNRHDLISYPSYNRIFVRVREVKMELEGIKNNPEEKSFFYYINLLKRFKDKDSKIQIFNKIIRNTIYNEWNDDQKRIYEEIYCVYTEWKHYFISYTNRNAYETNNDNKKLINYSFPPSQLNKNTNCIAKLIVKYLNEENLTSFYDVDSIKCGDDIEDNIFEYCNKSFVFVQLVEKKIFSNPGKNKKNWCYQEYIAFENDVTFKNKNFKRLQFITTEEDFKPGNLCESYEHWYQKLVFLNYISLYKLNNKETRDKIHSLAKEILATADEMKKHLVEYYCKHC